jgi:hypothetical protein
MTRASTLARPEFFPVHRLENQFKNCPRGYWSFCLDLDCFPVYLLFLKTWNWAIGNNDRKSQTFGNFWQSQVLPIFLFSIIPFSVTRLGKFSLIGRFTYYFGRFFYYRSRQNILSYIYFPRVARWYIFRQKFWRVLQWNVLVFMNSWFILWPFGIFCGNLVYLFPFWYFAPRKIWQRCISPQIKWCSY